ncbi:gamma-glutamyltransferase family protein [Alteribacter populi]|uniref:gamma-glutamyltransferase family protein n=1 Tax=Alteribacter populi TaxID=2011011 RepID=UPI000BBB55BF|nr:gamma-glutamyltransferase [Alteribacter populi]
MLKLKENLLKNRIVLFLTLLFVGIVAGTVIFFYLDNSRDKHDVTISSVPEHRPDYINDEVEYHYGVSSDNPIATEIGMNILENGGNAIDATIAIAFALATLEPYASGIGGDGVLMVHPVDEEPIVYDYRAMAPVSGPAPPSGIGVPGFIAGMDKVHKDFGSIPFEKLIEPSVELAENGIEIDGIIERRLIDASYRMPVNDLPLFYPDGLPIRSGETLIQEEFSETLRLVMEEGADVFYQGKVGESIASQVSGLEVEDFKSYEVKIREPIKGSFYGYDVYSPPAPSSGTMLIQSLQMAEILGIEKASEDHEEFAHLLGEINRRVHKEKNEYIGDPDFVSVQEEDLSSIEHSMDLSETINSEVKDEKFQSQLDTQGDRDGHSNTTHFVVVDKDGTMVSITNTLSNFFGSGIYVDGFFMNNQMHNFSDRQSSPNREERGKRSNSHMAPSILAHDHKPIIGIGSAGGRRISSVITQTLVRTIVNEEPVQHAIDAPRFYLEVYEDTLFTEDDREMDNMRDKGYQINHSNNTFNFGSVNLLVIDHESGEVHGGADPRRNGSWEENNRSD